MTEEQLQVLDDDLLCDVLCRADDPTLAALSTTCRRLLHLVRQHVPCHVHLSGGQGQHLLHLPPQRTFRGATSLTCSSMYALEDLSCMAVAMRHAAQHWPQLQQVVVTQEGTQESHLLRRLLRSPGASGALLHPLQPLRHLQRLSVPLFEPGSLVYVAALTQLTGLSLVGDLDSAVTPLDLSPLRQLRGLSELCVTTWVPADMEEAVEEGAAEGQAAGAAGQPLLLTTTTTGTSSSGSGRSSSGGCLPTGLIKLRLDSCSPDASHWWPHVAGCKQLQVLEVKDVLGGTWAAHPAAMIHVLAPHLQQLHTLRLINTSAAHAQMFGDPAARCDWLGEPDAALIPLHRQTVGRRSAFTPLPPAVSTLPALTCLEGVGWTLEVHDTPEWDMLASCSKLQRLGPVLALFTTAPSSSPQPLHLTYLHVHSPRRAGLASVLAAAPALRELVVEDDAHQQSLNNQGTEPFSSHLTRLTLQLTAFAEGYTTSRAAQMQLVSWFSSKLPQLQHLDVQWSLLGRTDHRVVQRLPLSGFRQLRTLSLRPARASMTGPVAAERLLDMVLPLQQLQELAVMFEVEELAGSSGEEGDGQVADLGAAWKQQLPHLVLLKTLAGEVRLV